MVPAGPTDHAQHGQQTQPSVQKRSSVFVSNVVTEPELVQRSLQLETTLKNGNMLEFCELKIAESTTKGDQQIWKFIKANFADNPNKEFLNLLGYDPERVHSQVNRGNVTFAGSMLVLVLVSLGSQC